MEITKVWRKYPLAVMGLGFIAVMVCLSVAAPWIAPYPFDQQDLPRHFQGPSREHWMGCDSLGRDVLSRVLYGGRVSLRIGLVVVGVSAIVGLFAGAAVGYAGGIWDEGLMRLSDVFLAFPGILLAIMVVSLLGPGIDHVMIGLCLTGWVGYARLIRGQVLQIREFEYVKAAVALGCGPWRVLVRHILPAVLPPLVVQATVGMAAAIMAEGSLSFLGLGVRPPWPSWGAMLQEGVEAVDKAPHLTLFPGLAIAFLVVGLNFLGDGLREALEPKRR